jgi:hypothetical protein
LDDTEVVPPSKSLGVFALKPSLSLFVLLDGAEGLLGFGFGGFGFFDRLVQLILKLALSAFEFANAFAQTPSQIRNFFSAEENDDGQKDPKPFASAGETDAQEKRIHLLFNLRLALKLRN